MDENQKNEVSVREVLDHLRITGVYNQQIREVLAKNITAQIARDKGISVTDDELQRTADAFRMVNNLEKAKVFEDWLTKPAEIEKRAQSMIQLHRPHAINTIMAELIALLDDGTKREIQQFREKSANR